jgi:hypothetical protein
MKCRTRKCRRILTWELVLHMGRCTKRVLCILSTGYRALVRHDFFSRGSVFQTFVVSSTCIFLVRIVEAIPLVGKTISWMHVLCMRVCISPSVILHAKALDGFLREGSWLELIEWSRGGIVGRETRRIIYGRLGRGPLPWVNLGRAFVIARMFAMCRRRCH